MRLSGIALSAVIKPRPPEAVHTCEVKTNRRLLIASLLITLPAGTVAVFPQTGMPGQQLLIVHSPETQHQVPKASPAVPVSAVHCTVVMRAMSLLLTASFGTIL